MTNDLLEGLWGIWGPGAVLPQPPPGYIHPVTAFNFLGREVWGEDWRGDEMRASLLPIVELPHSSMVFDGGNLSLGAANKLAREIHLALKTLGALHPGKFPESEVLGRPVWWEGARHMLITETARIKCAIIRRDGLLGILGGGAAAGRIRAVHRPKGGGAWLPIEPEAWGLDDYLPRFVSCGVDPADWTACPPDPPHRFFLSADDIRAGVERSSDVQPVAAAERMVLGRVERERKAREWLLGQFADAGTISKGKAVFRAEAESAVPGLLTSEFTRAWVAACEKHPERALAGRKKSTG